MPTYSYACTECDNRFDVVQAFTDQSLTVCPACSGRLRKLFSAVGIVFKGSGFYRNDSRSGPGHHNGSPAKGEGSSDTSSGETKSTETKSADSKPAEKGSGTEKKSGSTEKPSGSKATSSSASAAKSGANTS